MPPDEIPSLPSRDAEEDRLLPPAAGRHRRISIRWHPPGPVKVGELPPFPCTLPGSASLATD